MIQYTWGRNQWGQFPWGGSYSEDNDSTSFEFDKVQGELKLYYTDFYGYASKALNEWTQLKDHEGNNLLVSVGSISIKTESINRPSKIESSAPDFYIYNRYEPTTITKRARWVDNLAGQTVTAGVGRVIDKIWQLRLAVYYGNQVREIPLCTVLIDDIETHQADDVAIFKSRTIISKLKEFTAEKCKYRTGSWHEFISIENLIRYLIQKDNGESSIQNGNVSSVTSNTLSETSKFYGMDLTNCTVKIEDNDSPANGEKRLILSNTADTLLLNTDWLASKTPLAGDRYKVYTDNGYSGIFSKADVDYFFNNGYIDYSGYSEEFSNIRTISNLGSIKDSPVGKNMAHAVVFNNNNADSNELYIGAENKLFYADPTSDNFNDSMVEITGSLTTDYYIVRTWINRISDKDHLYGCAVTRANNGAVDEDCKVSMIIIHYNITDNYYNASEGDYRPNGSYEISGTISDVVIGQNIETYTRINDLVDQKPVFYHGAFKYYNTNYSLFVDQYIKYKWYPAGLTTKTSFDIYPLIEEIPTQDASSDFYQDINSYFINNKIYFGLYSYYTYFGTAPVTYLKSIYFSGQRGFLVFSPIENKIFYQKRELYLDTLMECKIYSFNINTSDFSSSTADNHIADVGYNLTITNGCIDSSGNLYVSAFRPSFMRRKYDHVGIVYEDTKNAMTNIISYSVSSYLKNDLYLREDKTTSGTTYDYEYRTPIISEMQYDVNNNRLILCGYGAWVDGGNLNGIGFPYFNLMTHSVSVRQDSWDNEKILCNTSDMDLTNMPYGLIQGDYDDDYGVYFIKQGLGSLYKWDITAGAITECDPSVKIGNENYLLSNIVIDNRDINNTKLFGVSLDVADPLATGKNYSSNNSQVWTYSKTLSNVINLADLSGLDDWDCLSQLGQALNRVVGIYPDGRFFFKPRPLVTDTAYINLNNMDYCNGINKNMGYKRLKNEFVAVPYFPQHGNIGVTKYDSNIYEGGLEAQSCDNKKKRIFIKITGATSLDWKTDDDIWDYGEFKSETGLTMTNWNKLTTAGGLGNILIKFTTASGITANDQFEIVCEGMKLEKQVNLEQRIQDYDSIQLYGLQTDDSMVNNRFISSTNHARKIITALLAYWKDPMPVLEIKQARLNFFKENFTYIQPLDRADLISPELNYYDSAKGYLIEFGFDVRSGSVSYTIGLLPS